MAWCVFGTRPSRKPKSVKTFDISSLHPDCGYSSMHICDNKHKYIYHDINIHLPCPVDKSNVSAILHSNNNHIYRRIYENERNGYTSIGGFNVSEL